MRESNRTEFKKELNERFERAVVSFLNYPGGGEILIGVNDDGEPIDVDDPDEVQRKAVDIIRNNIRPQTLGLFDVVLDKTDDKEIVRVIVSCGQQRPYYIRKKGMNEDGCFIRVGSSTQAMTEQMIENLIAKRQQLSLYTMISPRQDLTFRQLRIHYERRKVDLPENFIDSLDLRLSTGEFNYAAYLLADENGESFRVACYAGNDKSDLVEITEYGYCCIITATQSILDRMRSENRTFALKTASTRLEKERVDSRALREAIINAIVHNDYSKNVPLVEIYEDRIVVTSGGGLVPDLTEKEFFECRSMPRNRELMRVFRDVELVEQLGSGMKKILEAYDRSIFEFTPSFVAVTFPFRGSFKKPGSKSDDDRMLHDDPVLEIVEAKPTVTIPELAYLTGMSPRTISRRLKEFQEKEIMHRDGARKKGQWIIDVRPSLVAGRQNKSSRRKSK